jgi:serine/threonine protein kinase
LTKSIELEIDIQRQLLHQNIAQIYEVVKTENKIYVFMEYCPNGELFQLINQKGPMSEREAVKIFNQILSALKYLKENKLSHRDIKPENILFDREWNVKLIDFGFTCSND